jgi:hypothetical protein
MILGAQFTAVSDAPSCGVTYNRHSDNSRGAIYDRNIFIVQATSWFDIFTIVFSISAHLFI